MHTSYSLRIPKVEPAKKQRRKRKIVVPIHQVQYNAYKYQCYSCGADVYFLPGHELACAQCASRIVSKSKSQEKRIVSAR
jgi:DNA-directed RNA polymerase subunit RPC12/RpoP